VRLEDANTIHAELLPVNWASEQNWNGEEIMAALRVCLCTGLLAFLAGVAEASFIDAFDAGDQTLFVWSGKTNADDQANPGTSTAIGGYRDIALTWYSGELDFANVLASAGIFTFTQGTSEGEVAITWDGENSKGVLGYLLGANLTSGDDNQFLLNVASVTGTGVDLTMTVYTDATHASKYDIFPLSSSGIKHLYYSDFSAVPGYGAANFSNVGAVVLKLNGTGHVGSDITIGPIQTVPEPSTLALAAIGTMVLGFGWRRRRI
jgi:hypothetical protein